MISWVIATIIVLVAIILVIGFVMLLDYFDLAEYFLNFLLFVLIVGLFILTIKLVHLVIV